jgi:hypothetical protein
VLKQHIPIQMELASAWRQPSALTALEGLRDRLCDIVLMTNPLVPIVMTLLVEV